MNQGKIIFISGPSGVGKGTLISELKLKHQDWIFPPSCTTRDPRPGEVEGETYYFVSKEEFQKKIDDGEFLEWANVHNQNFYGTLKSPLLDGVKKGRIVVREFDVQGFLSAREALPKDHFISIFLKPAESVEDLMERVRARAPISDDEVTRRIESIKKELETSKFYDFEIISVGGEIQQMVDDAEKIIAENT
ncbi:MAG: guanylate kinase [Candidatus Peregrinibacteria bacterium]|nr:guanylate kinase [Candidatus Peregrinibacteria bacterium]